MKFTFGIITKNKNNFGSEDPSSSDKTNIMESIESINNLGIPEYEIIVVGGDDIYSQENVFHFENLLVSFFGFFANVYFHSYHYLKSGCLLTL